MVNLDDTQTLMTTRPIQAEHQASIKRWLKHVLCFKSSKRLFSLAQQQQIAAAIAAAEDGHQGEIQIVIEGSLPSLLAYDHSIRQRAEWLFAEYRVWDTEYNSGILIYINLCAKSIELVADRGIHHAVEPDYWQAICQLMLPLFQQKKYTEGLCLGVENIGLALQKFYATSKHKDFTDNELANMPRLL